MSPALRPDFSQPSPASSARRPGATNGPPSAACKRKELLATMLAEPGDDDDLTAASNAPINLIRAGKLDEAEAATRDLLVKFHDLHNGWDRLGMVHEKRGQNAQAADCYRRVIEIIRQNPDDYDPAFEDKFVQLIARLDPPSAP